MKKHYTKKWPALFEPRERDRSFLLSVVMTTAKMLVLLVLMIGMGGAGLLAGVAKAWIDTAPALDLEQIQTQIDAGFDMVDEYMRQAGFRTAWRLGSFGEDLFVEYPLD